MLGRGIACALVLACSAAAGAQSPGVELQWVNSEWERYWRVLQVAGDVADMPWSIRPLGPRALERLQPQDHPWSRRDLSRGIVLRGFQLTLQPLDAQLIANSSFPYGFNEGPVWAGRGLTASVRGGASFSAGRISGALAPVIFQAQNAAFELYPNGLPGDFAFGFPYPWAADMPQRFGDRAYRRLDPGNSFLRADVGLLSTGFSTAAQHWGPARDHPVILGSNAGGYPHLFLGTSRPAPVGPFRVQARLTWGRLSQSRYTTMELVQKRRLAVGAVGTVSLAAIPGLELGAGRFVHILWSDDVLTRENALKPFGPLLGQTATNSENQIASVFGRWVHGRSGVEVYGEFGREDGNLSWRHLLIEPDHASAYMLGMQRVWKRSSDQRSAVRAEVLNTRSTTPHLIPAQTPWYVHSPISQGHTHRGLALGSAGGFGGGASTVAYDRYTPAGRWTVSWARLMRAELLTSERGWVPLPNDADVFHAIGADGLIFRGRTALTWEVRGVYEANRNFGGDAFNLRVGTGVRHAW